MVGRILWTLGNLILLAAVLARQSDAATVLGRYSLTYAVGVVFSLALVAGVAALTWTPPGRRLATRLAARMEASIAPGRARLALVMATILIALTAFWSLPFDLGHIRHLVLFNGVLAAVALISRAPARKAEPEPRQLILLWALLLTVLVVSFFSAHAVPVEQSSGDEVAWTNMAVTWNTSGQAYIKFSGQDVFPITPGAGWWVAPYGLWLRVFGVSLGVGRMFIWLAYLAAVAGLGFAGARLYDRQTGLTAALLTVVSPLLLSFRIIRPEIGLAAVGALLPALYSASRKRPLWAFAAGWLAILSLEIHAAGLAYIVALLILYGLDSLGELRARRNPFTRQALAVVAGMGAGTLIYLALHVLIQTEPAAYISYLQTTRSFLAGGPWVEWVRMSVELLWARSPLEVLLIGVAIAGLIARRTPGDRLVLRFFAVTLVCYFILIPEPHRYLVIFIPFIAWGMAALISYGFKAAPAPPRPAVSLLALAALSAPFFAVSLPGVALNPMPPIEPTLVVERVRALTDPSDVVVGDAFSYWGLADYPRFFATWAEYELTRGLGYATGDDLWAAINPSLVFNVYRPGFPEMPPALRRHIMSQGYVLVDSFTWQGYPVEIYQRPDEAP